MWEKAIQFYKSNSSQRDFILLLVYFGFLFLLLILGGLGFGSKIISSLGLTHSFTNELILLFLLVMVGLVIFITRRWKECQINENKVKALSQETKASIERQKAILRNLPAIIYLLDSQQNYKFTWVSPNIQEITGYAVEEYYQDPKFWIEHIHPEDLSRVKATMKTLPQAKMIEMEYRWRYKDGTFHWLRDRAVLTDRRYEGLGDVLGFHLDFTEQKRNEQTQETLRKMTIQLSAVRSYKAAGDIIVMTADKLIGWDACLLNIYDPDEGRILVDVKYDLINGKRTMIDDVEDTKEVTPFVMEIMEKGPRLILRTEQEMVEPQEGFLNFGDRGRKSASLMFVPIQYASKLVGMLSIQSYTLNAYTKADLDVLATIAAQCGGAIDRIRVENQLWEAEEKYRLLVENMNESILITQNDKLIYFNKRFLEMLGYTLEELINREYQMIYPPQGLELLEIRKQRRESGAPVPSRYETTMKRKDGSLIDVEANVTVINYQGALATLAVINDITERKYQEDQIRYLATHDGLTGLYNHREFYRRFKEEVERCKRYHHAFSLLMIDLDHFKNINDSYGHPVGDEVLRTVSQLLKDIRNVDIIARYGGEEIAIIMPQVGKQAALFVSERLRKKVEDVRISAPGGKKIQITISIGIAVFPDDSEDGDVLIHTADQCLYAAKRLGRNMVQATPLPFGTKFM
jgi:diguanylate cyclase (GGDEF)-like protein/PAS domain S-box-containing protein